jgi:DNA polymerase-3 subunit alpha
LLAWEKELLGIWLSEHPFRVAAPILATHVTALCNEITPELLTDLPSQGRDFVIAGMVGTSRRLTTRDGRSFIAAELEDLSGTLEVTVWPDIYERTADLWSPGRIVLAQVRVRERGERLSAGVNEVEPFVDDFVAPSWLTESPDPAPRRNGNGYTNGNGSSRSVTYTTAPTPSEPPVRVAEQRAEFYAAADTAPQATANVEVVTQVKPALHLTLTESPDEDADQRRLASVFKVLQSQPGSDEVYLTINTREGETIDLSLGRARLDDGLRARLEQALSPELAATS